MLKSKAVYSGFIILLLVPEALWGQTLVASAQVNLQSPLEVSESSALNFGNIVNLSGSCHMQDDGELIASGGQTCSGTQVPAQFNINGDAGSSVDVFVGVNHSIPGLTFVPKLVGDETKNLVGGSASFQVVGTLNISSPTEGTYAVPYVVTVNYQ
ncbi:hypothetical protein NBRC116188_27160 [Oceaniserpentilla sp. 4NH20-0058]|uniref:DUF4402 domain-containing protein n=1 Tax=Oceaniserpentilla sp. 4NH20-0058 TaxID=3127660 RepID=UPI00310483BF